VAYLTYEGKLQFRDVHTGRLTLPLTLTHVPARFGAWWSPDSRELVTSGGSGATGADTPQTHTLQIWDPRSAAARTREVAGYDYVQFTHDSRRLVTVSERGTVAELDRTTLEPVREPVSIGRWHHGLPVLTPDDKTLYVPLDGGETEVVDLRTGHTTRAPKGRIPSTLAFSPDGSRVATMDDHNMWGLMSAAALGDAHPDWLLPPREFNGPHEFQGLDWSLDASQLITVGPGAVDLWDARTLGHLGTLDVGAADQRAAARPLPDGRILLLAHPGGAVATWDLRPSHLIDAACRLAGRNLTQAEWADLVGTRPYRATCPRYR
jgi:WD40 repeat protein